MQLNTNKLYISTLFIFCTTHTALIKQKHRADFSVND